MERLLIIIFLFVPAILSGILGILSVYFSAAIYQLFNPRYVLPKNKAWIDVAPVSSQLFNFYVWYVNFLYPLK